MASRNNQAKHSSKKNPNLMPISTKSQANTDDQSSDDEEDALEMERNFALLSKRSHMQTSAENEQEEDDEEEIRDDGGSADDDRSSEGEGDDEVDEDNAEDDEVDEDNAEDDGDDDDDDDGDPGSDEDESESDSDSKDAAREGSSKTKSHTDNDIKKELSTMSFEEIMELQNKVGTKVYNKIAYGAPKQQQQQKTDPMKRLNKHRPQEISSKKRVPFLRKVVPAKKKILRDPRFDDLSGEYKPEIFNQTFKFISDLRERETQMVKKAFKKAKSVNKKEELKALLKRMENQQRARQRQEQEREKELHFKRKQRELVGQGHKPFYLKKSDKKKLELAEKYSDLKKSGKLENFLSKKRKRNAIKDRRKLPNQHKTR